MEIYLTSPLQLREIFHLEFLRRLAEQLPADCYALKGGVNLRFFFQSPRYSEDLDIDVRQAGVARIRNAVMRILSSPALMDTLRSHGITAVLPPDLARAKQTETTQRFKIHLRTPGGLDLFTKVEFSRRHFGPGAMVGAIDTGIVRAYRVAPLIISHYGATAAFAQKIEALAGRTAVQARDIFDLYLLESRLEKGDPSRLPADSSVIRKGLANLFSVEFPQFRDTVLAFLDSDTRRAHESQAVWDEIRLTVSRRLEGLLR